MKAKDIKYGTKVVVTEGRYRGQVGVVYMPDFRPHPNSQLHPGVEFKNGCGVCIPVRSLRLA